jgi:hypothetical protein
MGTVVTGTIVFAILAAVVIRLVYNARKGKAGCGCGCAGCAGCAAKESQNKF